MKMIPELYSDNLFITVLKPGDSYLLATYVLDNKPHLAKWEPERDDGYYTDIEIKMRVQKDFDDFYSGKSVTFVGLNPARDKIVCVCQFSNIVYGVFQACNLGYSIDAKYQGKGLMFEMLSKSIEYMFSEFGLHRIMANYIPGNIRSEKLLARLGFEVEGLAKSYLKIDGQWQDHVLTSKICGV